MPTFESGQSVMATARFTLKPAGLICEAELYLGEGKASTSGVIPFSSTGGEQAVQFPMVMPGEGSYQALLDISAEGVLIGAFYDPEPVVITAPSFSYGTPVVTLEMDQVSPGFIASQVTCVVTNPASVAITRTLFCWYQKVDEPNKSGTRHWDDPVLWSAEQKGMPLTLNPGQSVTVISPFYWFDYYDGRERTNPPLMLPGYQFYYWIEDDLGNQSPKTMITGFA